VQDVANGCPVVLVGSGVSMGCAAAAHVRFPGMWHLGRRLFGAASPPKELAGTGDAAAAWTACHDLFETSGNFEQALCKAGNAAKHLEGWVAGRIADVVGAADRRFARRLVGDPELRFPLADLLRVLKRGPHVNRRAVIVITTNYDQLVEYACDRAGLRCATGFFGAWHKEYADDPDRWMLRRPGRRRGKADSSVLQPVVRLYKIHGSINWFRRGEGTFECHILPRDATRLVVPPGEGKPAQVMGSRALDQLRSSACTAIGAARSLLVLGYGFQDNTLAQHLAGALADGRPAAVVTRRLSAPARELVQRHPQIVALEAGGRGRRRTRWWHQGDVVGIWDGPHWDLASFVEGVLG